MAFILSFGCLLPQLLIFFIQGASVDLKHSHSTLLSSHLQVPSKLQDLIFTCVNLLCASLVRPPSLPLVKHNCHLIEGMLLTYH